MAERDRWRQRAETAEWERDEMGQNLGMSQREGRRDRDELRKQVAGGRRKPRRQGIVVVLLLLGTDP